MGYEQNYEGVLPTQDRRDHERTRLPFEPRRRVGDRKGERRYSTREQEILDLIDGHIVRLSAQPA